MVKGQMDMVEKFAVGLIVNNRFGVLNRIAGLYAKRCYNLTFTLSETKTPAFPITMGSAEAFFCYALSL